jgi:hypothetical protein
VAVKIRVSSAEADQYDAIVQRLRRYRALVADYKACKELYDFMFPSCTSVMSDMPKIRTDVYEPERWASRRIDIREQCARSLDEMQLEYSEIEKMIGGLQNEHHTVLVRRYLLGETWEAIGLQLHYCERQIRNIHNKAISQIISNFFQNNSA